MGAAVCTSVEGPRERVTGKTLDSPGDSPRSPWNAAGVVDNDRERVLSRPITYVDHPSYHDPLSVDEILGPCPTPEGLEVPSREAIPGGLPAYLKSLYSVPLLTRERETRLFRQWNCLKAMAERLRLESLAGETPIVAPRRIEALLERAHDARDLILRANQRLVVSIAKRFAGRAGDLFEMISDANLPLIEAAERFDFSRGFRFSTYATWAIRNGLIRSLTLEKRQKERYVHGVEELFSTLPDDREVASDFWEDAKNPWIFVQSLLERLTERERVVLEGRYGLDGARRKSHRQIGGQIGVSKERARQIEIAARAKLRRLVGGPAVSPLPFLA